MLFAVSEDFTGRKWRQQFEEQFVYKYGWQIRIGRPAAGQRNDAHNFIRIHCRNDCLHGAAEHIFGWRTPTTERTDDHLAVLERLGDRINIVDIAGFHDEIRVVGKRIIFVHERHNRVFTGQSQLNNLPTNLPRRPKNSYLHTVQYIEKTDLMWSVFSHLSLSNLGLFGSFEGVGIPDERLGQRLQVGLGAVRIILKLLFQYTVFVNRFTDAICKE